MEQNSNIEYKGFKANGFLMLFAAIALIAVSIWGIVHAVNVDKGLTAILGGIGILVALISLIGLMVIEPNQARVLVFFGKYRGNFLKEGFWWVNPFMSVKKISLRARNLNAEPIKVNDKMGNPIMIGLVLVWKVKAEEIYKAVFNIDAPKQATTTTKNANGQVDVSVTNASETRMDALANFVAVQSDAALRQVAGNYAYDNNSANEGELSLRSNADEINDQLEMKLSERLEMAGIEVVEARINYLAYAPEIAAVMLRRQQADAIISAREKIVEGAVSMVKMAIDQLAENEVVEARINYLAYAPEIAAVMLRRQQADAIISAREKIVEGAVSMVKMAIDQLAENEVVELDEERKAAMVSNLLVVLCSDESAQPVVNAGTLHH